MATGQSSTINAPSIFGQYSRTRQRPFTGRNRLLCFPVTMLRSFDHLTVHREMSLCLSLYYGSFAVFSVTATQWIQTHSHWYDGIPLRSDGADGNKWSIENFTIIDVGNSELMVYWEASLLAKRLDGKYFKRSNYIIFSEYIFHTGATPWRN